MKLLSEIRAQFSLNEWLSAMKQGVKELRTQINLREWIAAFLFYVPTAHAKRMKGGYRTVSKGGTAEQIHSALVLMQYQLKNGSNPN